MEITGSMLLVGIGKFAIKKALKKLATGTATTGDLRAGYNGLDLAGDQDRTTEIEDVVQFIGDLFS